MTCDAPLRRQEQALARRQVVATEQASLSRSACRRRCTARTRQCRSRSERRSATRHGLNYRRGRARAPAERRVPAASWGWSIRFDGIGLFRFVRMVPAQRRRFMWSLAWSSTCRGGESHWAACSLCTPACWTCCVARRVRAPRSTSCSSWVSSPLRQRLRPRSRLSWSRSSPASSPGSKGESLGREAGAATRPPAVAKRARPPAFPRGSVESSESEDESDAVTGRGRQAQKGR